MVAPEECFWTKELCCIGVVRGGEGTVDVSEDLAVIKEDRGQTCVRIHKLAWLHPIAQKMYFFQPFS